MKPGKNNTATISKGYRLKPSTHNMVKKIQNISNSTQDKVVRAAMKLYFIHLKSNFRNIPKGEAI
ncbi:MAG: hypothetical protein ABI543_12775 [Ignavibacteria bacterium]